MLVLKCDKSVTLVDLIEISVKKTNVWFDYFLQLFATKMVKISDYNDAIMCMHSHLDPSFIGPNDTWLTMPKGEVIKKLNDIGIDGNFFLENIAYFFYNDTIQNVDFEKVFKSKKVKIVSIS